MFLVSLLSNSGRPTQPRAARRRRRRALGEGGAEGSREPVRDEMTNERASETPRATLNQLFPAITQRLPRFNATQVPAGAAALFATLFQQINNSFGKNLQKK